MTRLHVLCGRVFSLAIGVMGSCMAEDFVYVRATPPGQESEIHWFPTSDPQSARVLVEDLSRSNTGSLYRYRDELWWRTANQTNRGNLVGQAVNQVPNLNVTTIVRQGDSVYWQASSRLGVYRISTEESEVLFTGGRLRGLVLHEDRLYFGNGFSLDTIRLDGAGHRIVGARNTAFSGSGGQAVQALAKINGKLVWVRENQFWEVDLKTEEASLLSANLPETPRAVAASDSALYWIGGSTVWRWLRGSENHEPLYQLGETRFGAIEVVTASPVGARMEDKEEVSVVGEAGESYQLLYSPDLSSWAPDFVERSLFSQNGVLQWLNSMSLDTDGPVVWHPKLSDRQAYFAAWRYELEPPFDADGDQLPDYWERRHFGDLSAEPDEDSNGDGQTHLEEAALFIGPSMRDSDGDGLSDREELAFEPPLDPASSDTDGDTLTDGEEVKIFGSDPNLPDSDSDGFRDDFEVTFETDPNDSENRPGREEVLAFYAGELVVHFDFEAAEGSRVPNLGTLGGLGRVIGEEVYVMREDERGNLSRAIQFPNPDDASEVASYLETDFSLGDFGLASEGAEFSIGMWLKHQGPPNGPYFSMTGPDGAMPSMEATVSGIFRLPEEQRDLRYQLRGRLEGEPWSSGVGGRSVVSEVWAHVLLSAGPAGWRVYVNGENRSRSTEVAVRRFEEAPVLWLGAQRARLKAMRPFRGSIDDVRVYRRQFPDGAVKLLAE